MTNRIFVMGGLLMTLVLLSACYAVLHPVAPPPAPTLQASPWLQKTAPPTILAPPTRTATSLSAVTASPASALTTPVIAAPEATLWWNDAVFYEIFVRSFADSSTGPLAGDGIGDLQGLI